MQYPFRVKINFKEKHTKLPIIQYVNRFMNNDAIDKWEKYTIMQTNKYGERVMAGIELAFASNVDAVHFKLGFDYGTEEIS